MPPWLPEHGYGDFAGEQRLTDAQIRILSEWAKNGAPKGPAEAPPLLTSIRTGNSGVQT